MRPLLLSLFRSIFLIRNSQHPHSNAKLLHSYKTALSVTSLSLPSSATLLSSELQKISLSHSHPMSRLRHQVCVNRERMLTKHFFKKIGNYRITIESSLLKFMSSNKFWLKNVNISGC